LLGGAESDIVKEKRKKKGEGKGKKGRKNV
jgi:hypothetical protein